MPYKHQTMVLFTCILPLVHTGGKAILTCCPQSSFITNMHCKLQLNLGFLKSIGKLPKVIIFSVQHKYIYEFCVDLFVGEKTSNKPARLPVCIPPLHPSKEKKQSRKTPFRILMRHTQKLTLYFKHQTRTVYFLRCFLQCGGIRKGFASWSVYRGAVFEATMNNKTQQVIT